MKKILFIAMFYLLVIQVKGQCTFGNFPPTYTASGAWTNSTWITEMYTLSTTATLTGFGLHTNATSQTQYSMALYTDNSGLPGNMIAVSGEGTMTLGQNTVGISTPTIIPAGNYWIMAYYSNSGTPVTNGSGASPIYYEYSPTGALPVSTTTWNSSAGDIDFWAVINTPSLTISGATAICSGGSSTLTASGAVTYTWDSGANTDTFVASPASNSSYTLSGTGTNGCSAGIITTVTVNALPSLSITGHSSVCVGSSVIETVSGASTYTWDNGVTTNTVSLLPSGTTIYTVNGTDLNGCNGTSTVSIQLNGLPTLAILGNNAVCAGTSITQTVTGATTYTWSDGSNSNTISLSPATTTAYSVSGTDANGCVDMIFSPITVNSLPVLSISGGSVVCAGSSITETVSGASTYTWDNGITTNSVSLSPANTTTYTVSGTDANGCDGTATVSIQVNALPALTIAGNNVVCAGASLTQTVTGAITYSWSDGTNGNTVSLSPATTTVYNVSGTDANGCIGTINSSITVNSLPVLSISGGSAVCTGFSVTETVSGASTYTWDNGAITSTVSLSPAATTVYSVNGTDNNGCTGTSTVSVIANPLPTVSITGDMTICPTGSLALIASGANTYSWNTGALTSTAAVAPVITTDYTVTGTDVNGCTNLSSVSVSVYPQPTVSISGNQPVCEGESLTLTASGAANYLWINGTNGPVLTLSPATNTVFYVSGVNMYGCISTATAVIVVNPSPVITISLSHPVLCAGETGVIMAGNAVIWLWDTGATTMFLTVSPTVTTTYSVTGIDLNGCSSSTTAVQTVDNCTGLKTQSSNQTSVLVSPNPGHDLFNVSISNLDENSMLEIFNASGSMIKREKITSQQTVINLENEANGLYYMIVSTGSDRIVKKIIKE